MKMIEKVKSLFFIILVLANINILAHNIILHHYHKNKICDENSHCQTHSEAHEHSNTDHDHEHDGESSVEHCISNQEFVIRSNRAKLDWKYLDFVDNRINLNQFQANLPDHELLSSVRLYLNNTQPTLIFLSHCQYFGNDPGLRAPPNV